MQQIVVEFLSVCQYEDNFRRLCDTICGVCKATPIACSRVTRVRAGFVCLTTSAPAYSAKAQGRISGENESKAFHSHFSLRGHSLSGASLVLIYPLYCIMKSKIIKLVLPLHRVLG